MERDHVMALDFDPTVVGIASQPFWLSWRDDAGQLSSHAPDFFARRADDTSVVVEMHEHHYKKNALLRQLHSWRPTSGV